MSIRWRRDGDERSGYKKNATTANEEDEVSSVSEADVPELCKLGIGRVRDLVRPDTRRIGQAFDAMMSRVKVQAVSCVRTAVVVEVYEVHDCFPSHELNVREGARGTTLDLRGV